MEDQRRQSSILKVVAGAAEELGIKFLLAVWTERKMFLVHQTTGNSQMTMTMFSEAIEHKTHSTATGTDLSLSTATVDVTRATRRTLSMSTASFSISAATPMSWLPLTSSQKWLPSNSHLTSYSKDVPQEPSQHSPGQTECKTSSGQRTATSGTMPFLTALFTWTITASGPKIQTTSCRCRHYMPQSMILPFRSLRRGA